MQRTVATERVRAAVLEATLAALAEDGVAGLRIERVADAAGVAKTTIYRSWGTREALVADALAVAAAREVPTPDTGSLRGDLLALAEVVRRTITSEEGARVFAGFAATHDAKVVAIAQAYWRTRFAAHRPLVDRAVARGELAAPIDVDELLAALVGPLVFRAFIARAPVSAAYARRTVDRLLGGIAA